MNRFAVGQSVIVSPPMTPLARHEGVIMRKAKYGWRVRFDAWGMMLTETMPERALEPVGAHSNEPKPMGHGNEQERQPGPWKGARALHIMRREEWARRDRAAQKLEDMAFRISEIETELAKETARADAAEAMSAPALDKAQARITELEERLAALPKPKVPFKLAMTMGAYRAPVAMGRAG